MTNSIGEKPRLPLIVYTDQLLEPTYTFVRAQAEALKRYQACYVGSRRVAGLELPEDRVVVLNGGGLAGWAHEIAFKVGGLTGRLASLVRPHAPRLCHAHFGPDACVALPLCRDLGIPLVATFHGYDATVSDSFAARSFYRHRLLVRKRLELIDRTAIFIAVSEYIARSMRERGFPAERIRIHRIGIDLREFHPDPTAQRENIVLFVGRLVEKKGCHFLLRAMEQVQERHPDARLVVIGDGPLRATLQVEARTRLRSADFIGVISPPQVRAWMQRARVLCLPSLIAESGDAEGLGMVLLEAQAVGLPVVASRSGGIPEAVLDGETALLVGERDVAGIAAAIERLLQDSMFWCDLSARGPRHVRAQFDLERQTGLLEELYDEALRHPPTARSGSDSERLGMKQISLDSTEATRATPRWTSWQRRK